MKIHLRQGPNFPASAAAICGHNDKRGDGFTPLDCRSPEKFKAADERFLCRHCQTIFIRKRNEQRKKKGKPPLSTWNE